MGRQSPSSQAKGQEAYFPRERKAKEQEWSSLGWRKISVLSVDLQSLHTFSAPPSSGSRQVLRASVNVGEPQPDQLYNK